MMAEKVTKTRSFLGEPIMRLLILGCLFVIAVALNLYVIDQPSMEWNQDEQAN